MPETTKAGYDFGGWFASKDDFSDDSKRVRALPATMPAGTTTYYAKWTPAASTITFDPAGGTFADSSFTGSLTGVTDEALGSKLTAWPKVNGQSSDYQFLYWSNELGEDVSTDGYGNETTDKLPTVFPAGGATYTANWLYTGRVTITFDANGGTVTPASIQGFPGQNIAMRELPCPCVRASSSSAGSTRTATR